MTTLDAKAVKAASRKITGGSTFDAEERLEIATNVVRTYLAKAATRPSGDGIPPATQRDELAWVIESAQSEPSAPVYYCAGDPNPRWPDAWSSDNLKAIRFARKEDAGAIAGTFRDIRVRICEHGWN